MTWSDVLMAAQDRPLPRGAGILVLITMYGGNDGLNTVIPYTNDAYMSSRQELGYDASEVLQLDDEYGLNPGMPGMAKKFREGSVAIIRGVGYPEPDRSHFRSMDIWQSASLDNSVATGWVGRWLDTTGEDPLLAMHMGPVLPTLAMGEKRSAATFSSNPLPAAEMVDLISALSESYEYDTPAMAMVRASYRDTVRAQRELRALYESDGTARVELNAGLGSQLNAVSACIAANVPTRVYSVSIGGFDTHANERGTQERLLTKLDKAITRFVEKISKLERADDVVIMAYSEFGRRVRANASEGTDHGTAGPVFVLGKQAKGGFYGDDPSLTDLVYDDLKTTTDFRDVYHELLGKGLRTDPEVAVGARRKDIGFLRS
jgi:uncharacterized protein (DUF1501 family)